VTSLVLSGKPKCARRSSPAAQQLREGYFHWHMNGPHFRDYNLLLDDHGDQIFTITDDIAERVRKIGQRQSDPSGTSLVCSAFLTTMQISSLPPTC